MRFIRFTTWFPMLFMFVLVVSSYPIITLSAPEVSDVADVADAAIPAGIHPALEVCCPGDPEMTWEGRCKADMMSRLGDYEDCVHNKTTRGLDLRTSKAVCGAILTKATDEFKDCDEENIEKSRRLEDVPFSDEGYADETPM